MKRTALVTICAAALSVAAAPTALAVGANTPGDTVGSLMSGSAAAADPAPVGGVLDTVTSVVPGHNGGISAPGVTVPQ